MSITNPKAYKENTTTELRTCSPYHHIDPGFINRRKIFSVFGDPFIKVYEANRSVSEDHLSQLRNDQLMVQLCTEICKSLGVKSLLQSLFEGPGLGQLICSTEELKGNEDVWKEVRAYNEVILPFDYDKEVRLEYSTQHIFSDTTRSELSEGTTNSILGEIRNITDTKITALTR
jgi:hypothetical protein